LSPRSERADVLAGTEEVAMEKRRSFARHAAIVGTDRGGRVRVRPVIGHAEIRIPSVGVDVVAGGIDRIDRFPGRGDPPPSRHCGVGDIVGPATLAS